MFRGLLSFTCPLLALALLSSCGEQTKREYSEQSGLRERIDAFEAEFEALAAEFAYELEPITLPTPPAVPPTAENTATLSTRVLGSPLSNTPLTSDDYLNLGVGSIKGSVLQDSYASKPMEEGWPERVEEYLSKRYLVIYWALDYAPPVVADGKDFYEGGTAKLIISLYDRETNSYLLRFPVEGAATGFVQAEAEKWKLNQSLVFEVNKLLRKDLLRKMSTELEKQTGAILYRTLPEKPAGSDAVSE